MRLLAQTATVLLGALLTAGCARLGFGEAQPGVDGRRPAPLEAAPDGRRDGLPDGKAEDVLVKPEGKRPDLARKDGPVVKQDAGGCVPVAAGMELCSSGAGVTQCAAPQLCQSRGRHLCTPAEYEITFPAAGAAPPTLVQGAWLAACVFSEGTLIFTSSPCASCGAASSTDMQVALTCPPVAGDVWNGGYPWLGLTAWQSCFQVGSPVTGTRAGYWIPTKTKTPQKALCCQ